MITEKDLKPNYESPKIYFDLKNGVIRLVGNAVKEDFKQDFEVLSRWVELYCNVPNKTTRVDIEIETISETWRNLIGHILWYLVSLNQTNRTKLNIFWYVTKQDQLNALNEIEASLNYKIHKISGISD